MRILTIYRQIPGSNLRESEFDLIDQLSDNNYTFLVIDDLDILSTNHGWFFTEVITAKTAKVFLSLPADATIGEVLQVLREIKSGLLDINGNGTGTSVVKAKKEDYLIDLGADRTGSYKGLFPIITIANAPKWLTDLLNTLTGHGALSLYIWLAITAIIGSKMAMQKKRTVICWLILGFSAKMAYDAYRYRQELNQNKNA